MALDALRLAAGLLSVLPVGRLPEAGPRTYGRAILLAPLAVLPLALVAALVFGAASLAGLTGTVVGLLTVAALALGTRALHLDGLADTVDGLGTGWDAERALAVMRRGDVGPMGAVALVLVLGLQAASLSALPPTPGGALAVALLVCASRAALLLVCRRGVPAARPDGLGRTVAGTVGPVAGGAAGLVAVAVVLLAGHLAGRPWPQGLVAAALALVAVAVLVGHVGRRLGGVSGDVMGAAVEVALTALLVGVSR